MPPEGHTGGALQKSHGTRADVTTSTFVDIPPKDAEKRCSKALQPEITEKSGNLTEATANTGTNGGY